MDSDRPLHQPEYCIDTLRDDLSADQFREWYRERQYRRNIENGTPFFNEYGYIPEPERHTPSKLLQCHRKIFYRQHNAPAERPDPDGVFWFGNRFEEDILFPYLQDVTCELDWYVCNSIWIDFTAEVDDVEVRIKGATDPVIVDSDATPVLPTEAKTKESLDSLNSPSEHHLAQLHAYLAGLSEKYDIKLSSGTLVYGSRKSLEVKFFDVEFDEDFWNETVLKWARKHTQYRSNDELPPSNPEQHWECQFCEYRERCGKGEAEQNNMGVSGFLSGFRGYPREKVVEYLEADPDAKLTPTLAQQFPRLAAEYEVAVWKCDKCSSAVEPDLIEDSKDPLCPVCADRGDLSHLSLSSAGDLA